MNKAELVGAVAEHANLPKSTVAAALDGLLAVIPMAVAAGDQVAIVGFGNFEAVHRPARTGRNPQTGDPVDIAETWTPKFRPGSAFKGVVAASRALARA